MQQNYRSFTIDGVAYRVDTQEWPSFNVPAGVLYSTNGEQWIFSPNYGAKPDRLVEEDEAVDMLVRGGAYNTKRFEDLPLEVQEKVLERLGREA